MDVAIRRIAPGDGPLLRDLRLRALSDSPDAFGSTLANEALRDDAAWAELALRRSSGTTGANFLAEPADGAAPAMGIVGCFRDSDDVHLADLTSMWVDPTARRSGTARRLVERALEWAAAGGVTTVELWVTVGNTPAERLYESLGFAATGEMQPLPSNPAKLERRMNRSIADR